MRRGGETPANPDLAWMSSAVRQAQHDILRTAYLLSGDDEQARELARRGTLAALERAIKRDVDGDLRRDALICTAREWMAAGGARHSSAGMAGAIQQRYQVDDERSRMRAALDLLSRQQRAVLVLHDFAGLTPDDLRAVRLASDDQALNELLDMARERVRSHAGVEESGRLHGALARFSIDAPRVDLWPELSAPVRAMLWRSGRRQRRAAMVIAGLSVAVLLIFIVWWLGGGGETAGEGVAGSLSDVVESTRPPPTPVRSSPTATMEPTQEAPVAAPVTSDLPEEILLIQALDRETQAVYRVDLQHGIARLMSDPAARRFLSVDGRWALDVRSDVAFDEDGRAETIYRIQPVELPDRPGPGGWTVEDLVQDALLIDDSATLVLGSRQRPSVSVARFDMHTGQELARIEITPDDPDGSGPLSDAMQVTGYLFGHPESDHLYLIATLSETSSHSTYVGYSLATYALDAATLEPTLISSEVQVDMTRTAPPIIREIDLRSARLLPDGSGIYAWHPATPDERASVRILDFASGEIEVIDAPFSTVISAGPGRLPGIVTAPSNDGEQLYLISAHSQEAAIVDLLRREIARSFPLDLGGYPEAWLGAADIALSFDGERLYIVESAPYPVAPRDMVPTRATIWVLDLRHWRVSDRWDLATPVWDLIPAAQNDRLYITAPVLAQNQHQRNSPEVVGERLLVVEGGEITAEIRADDILEPDGSPARFTSWLTEYRDAFGQTPRIDGRSPGTLKEFTTLPRFEVVGGERGLPVETLLNLDLRLLDPRTGELWAGEPGDDAVLSLILTHADHNPVIALPSAVDDGVYRTTLLLPAEGWWDARLVVDGERSWSVGLDDAVFGAPTFAGTDGRTYYLALDVERVSQEPAGRLRIGAQWADADTGSSLPENVSLRDGLPELLHLSVVGANEGSRAGFDTSVLRPAAHGRYVADGELWGPGPWSVVVRMAGPDGEQLRVGGARIEYVPET